MRRVLKPHRCSCWKGIATKRSAPDPTASYCDNLIT
jgi:hypothetical protein